MKTFALAGIAAAAFIAIPALAWQQGPARTPAHPMTRAAVQAMVQARFAEADADRDGYVTRAEAEARMGAGREQRQARRGERRGELFARLDADGDGSISRAEFDARPERGPARQERRSNRMERRGERGGMMGAGFGARMFERADADKDGRISIAEATARPLAMFDRADGNKDGIVTVEERRAAWQAVRAQRQARPIG
jgi:hypothetical protein